MKKNLSTIILIIIFFIGFFIFFYPAISNYINSFNQSKVIAEYEEALANLSKDEHKVLLEDAKSYNSELLEKEQKLYNGESKNKEYLYLLNPSHNKVMGYITIKKLGVQLPIYHGTEEKVLTVAAGHLEGTSLPVGGKGSHAVITAHRGLPSAKLFTDLDKMEIGDEFTITVLKNNLNYQVDSINIVEPNNLELLKISPNEDYVTLVTCTPYAVNTHRLLVRGTRVESNEQLRITADAIEINSFLVAIVIAIPIIGIFLILVYLQSKKHKNRKIIEKFGIRKDDE